MINILSWLKDTFTSRISDQDIEALQDSVKVLNYELSLLRYKDSDDEDIRLAIEYLKKRPLSDALFPYELVREIPPVEVHQPDESQPVDISSDQPSWAEVECGDDAEVEDLITGPTYGELMEYLYNKVSFKDYVYVDSAKSSREILKYLYDKMDKDDFVDLVRFIFKF